LNNNVPEPVNAQERYLHATVIRLDALCHMVDSIVKHIAEKEKVTTVDNKVEENPVIEKPKPKRTSRRKKIE